MPAPRSAVHPLRGRAAELGTVLGSLRHAQQGRSALVVVQGEPGLGKSALLYASAEQAHALGFTVACATAHETDELSPLASLGPALRSGDAPVLGSEEFLELAPLTAQPLWLAEHLAGALRRRATSNPLLLVLDDAQWADPLTAFVLRILVGRLAAAPVAVLIGTRAAVGGPADQIAGGTERGQLVRWIDLAPLDDDAVLAIAADRLGRPADPELVCRLTSTGGNPFLAVQLVDGLLRPGGDRAIGDDLPAGLLDGVRRRTAGASERCRALLRAASVLGTRSRFDDVAVLMGEASTRLTEPLEEAIALGLLTDDGTEIAFRHELLRRAVYEDVPPSARAALHRAVVTHLLDSGRGNAAAAPHVLASAVPGDPTAVKVLRRAATELVGTMAITAVAFIRRAFELVGDDDPEREPVAQDVVAMLVTARRPDDAAAFADRLLEGEVSPDTAAIVQLHLAPRLWATDRRTELADRARHARCAGAAPRLLARLAGYEALAAGRVPQNPGPDPGARSLTLLGRAEEAERSGDQLTARLCYAEARAAAEEGAGEPGALPSVRLELRELVARGRLDDIEGALARLSELDARGGDSWLAPQVAVTRAVLELGAGRLDAAFDAARAARQWSGDIGDLDGDPRLWHVLAVVSIHRGETAEARSLIAEAEQQGVPTAVERALLMAAEDPRAAATVVREVGRQAATWPEELLVESACAAHHSHDTATLLDAAGMLAALEARNPGVTSIAGATALVDGLIIGKLAPAVELLRGASRPLLLARAEEELGRAALSRGDLSGVESLRRALDGYAACGATTAGARVQQSLRSAGVRRRGREPRGRPRSGWDALTEMERRVAVLISDGHTNRSAAGELFLSPSTINTHLRAVFTKLGVHSRVQLAKLVLARSDDQHLEPPSARHQER